MKKKTLETHKSKSTKK